MPHLTIQLQNQVSAAPCGFCGQPAAAAEGPGLCVAADGARVCGECGRRHAPALAALLHLADVARRVGRINRHTLTPPFEALLDLARAAESYTIVTGSTRKAA